MTMQRDQPFAVTLRAEQWNVVLQVLSEAPFRVAAPLIGEIEKQCRAQDTTAAVAEEPAAELPTPPDDDGKDHKTNGKTARR